MDDIHEDFLNTLLTLQSDLVSKNTARRTCGQKSIDFNELVHIPNPKNNIKVRKPNLENLIECHGLNKKPITVTKPPKLINNFFKPPKIEIVESLEHKNILYHYFNIWRRQVNVEKNQKRIKQIQQEHQAKIANFLLVLQKRKKGIEAEQKTQIKVIRSAQKLRPKRVKEINRKSCSAPTIITKSIEQSTEIQQMQQEIDESIKETRAEIRVLSLPKLPTCYKTNQLDGKLKITAKIPETILKSLQMAKNREERRKYLLEKKEVMKQQRKRLAEEAENERQRLELLARKQQLEESRERRRLEKELSAKIAQEKIRHLEKLQTAKMFYHSKIQIRYFKFWRKYVGIIQAKMKWAVEFDEVNLLQRCFRTWKFRTQKQIFEKDQNATEFARILTLKYAFKTWKEHHMDLVRKIQVADDFYDFQLTPKIFSKWHEYTCIQHVHWQELKGEAIVHYKSNLKKKYFQAWLKFPEIMNEERKKTERKEKWFLKVQEIIPNFEPRQD